MMRVTRWLTLSTFFAVATFVSYLSAFAAEPQRLPRHLLDQGWIELFDGETLFGWQSTGDARWQVKNGEIMTDGTKPGWLMTTTEWANYELHVEFQATPTTNSGVFLHTPLTPTDPTKDCYEVNIAPADNPFPTGSLVARAKILSDGEPSPRPGGWRTINVTVDRNQLKISLDGRQMVDYIDASPLSRGHIGLQSKQGPIAFRNIRLRPLGLKPLFNGKDLTGWTTAGAEQSELDATESGELRIVNGPGQIATDDEFANFVLQLECHVNGDGLNSGIFFRTLGDGRWQGYESQINNRVHNGDPTRPVDFGTGAIYRRQAARRVAADDHQWFTKTIVADGPHIAVWVNGLQVTDWTDTRPPHENAREGLRLRPGTIAIQGHDPTTNLLFRKLRIVELPE